MTVKELIDQLRDCDEDAVVMIGSSHEVNEVEFVDDENEVHLWQ